MAEKQSVLSRIGKGLVSFGTGTPQIALDQAQANVDLTRTQEALGQQQVGIQQQQLETDQAEAARNQQAQELTGIAMDPNNPDRDRALTRLFQIKPELASQVFEGIGARSQSQREDAARRAAEIQATPPEQRNQVIQRQAEDLRAQGRDPSDTEQLMGMAPEDQDNILRFTQAAALSAKERLAGEAGVDIPAGQREFESLIADFSPADQKKARRVKARIDAPAGTSSTERIALDKQLADLVAESQAKISEAKSFAQTTGTDRAKRIDTGFESIQKIDANIRTLDKVIAAIDEGASTGVIESRFLPTIRESTVELEQLQAQLGLDVVGSVQFGALSEGELNLALATALPTGLQPAQLRQWVESRQTAQGKLRDYYSDQIQFLDQGGTVAGFLRSQERQTPAPEQALDPALLEFMTPEERALFGQ